MTCEPWEKVAAARVRVGLLRGPGDGACADRGGRLITCSSALLCSHTSLKMSHASVHAALDSHFSRCQSLRGPRISSEHVRAVAS